MTDEGVIEGLLALSEDDRLSDDESDLVCLAARILEKREAKKQAVLAKLREALREAGES